MIIGKPMNNVFRRLW